MENIVVKKAPKRRIVDLTNRKPVIETSGLNKVFKINTEQRETFKSVFLNLFNPASDTRDFYALSGVDLKIYEGEFFGIIGRNGSGKSTLLKVLAEIYEPTSGTVNVHGKVIPFLELGVGFNPELSARENIYLNGVILGMSRNYIKSKFDEIVDFAEIRDFLDVPIKNYSSGMNVRLAFSIAIQADGDIYILDEVLAVGDAEFQKKCINHLDKVIKSGKTIIFVSHSLAQMRKYCNRCLYMEQGKVKMIGETDVVCDAYEASQQY